MNACTDARANACAGPAWWLPWVACVRVVYVVPTYARMGVVANVAPHRLA